MIDDIVTTEYLTVNQIVDKYGYLLTEEQLEQLKNMKMNQNNEHENKKDAFLYHQYKHTFDKAELVQASALQAVEVVKRIVTAQMLQLEKDAKLIEAIEIVCQALREDDDFYDRWQASIIISFHDEYFRIYNKESLSSKELTEIHNIMNNAAHEFLKTLTK